MSAGGKCLPLTAGLGPEETDHAWIHPWCESTSRIALAFGSAETESNGQLRGREAETKHLRGDVGGGGGRLKFPPFK